MEPTTLILFGATGDLAKRKIYPALYNLFMDRLLPRDFSVIGLGRREWSDEIFRENIEQSIGRFSRRGSHNPQMLKEFQSLFRYSVLDIGQTEDYHKLLGEIEEWEQGLGRPANRLFYLSVGPEFFGPIAENIQAGGLGITQGWKRLVIEKPFGSDLQTARELNRKLSASFSEAEIFIIDHYLGKPMLQEFQALRQSNPMIKALWKNQLIANVQITAGETVGVEERAGYYDHVGALRDMFQNHMLQLMMMTAIQLPASGSHEEIRLKKKQVMEDLVPVIQENMELDIVRGQYTAGSIDGVEVPGYKGENGISPDSTTETFVAARLKIDNDLWRGIPFYIRTGKRLKEKGTRIVIEFKEPVAGSVSLGSGPSSNLLILEMNPDERISLQLNVIDNPLAGPKPVQIDLSPSGRELPEAYENLILGALQGDSSYYAHFEEVEKAWRWVEPVLQAFAQNATKLHLYEAGTFGPEAANELLARDGYSWWLDSEEEPSHQLENAGLVQ
ncbi:glucose-6-phosphate dehydrogenase [Paenibacillus sp. HN-1]|uniref:glucose-6-phosphate dehydrogenase n=1 Tax=Paenibacillus TaxID=44249 RepID=UPI001CA90299|nr:MULTISPECIES: glucose-6-phosphate dehydrogenase [Paenibacillus]MBY9082442.1 glucose-6-phosphate dehydrogenase [Paenibacillus sp. CGMCC 1.18879]MBY9084801.1 glucose-6-phosphate dehydrogenase [Paenibacillus sinensis]